MKDVLIKNSGRALSIVLASILGTLGVVLLIALVVSQQSDNMTTTSAFIEYFRGGQIGLPILSLSGIIFIALRRYGRLHSLMSLILYVFLFGPIIATAFIVGLNPGFQVDILTPSNLLLLWLFYFGLHLLWFLILILEPTVPTAQEAAEAQEGRVNKIKVGAVGRV